MKVFIVKDHAGFWLSGQSVVVAENEAKARELLDAELQSMHLKPSSEREYELVEIDMNTPKVYVLDNGDY